MLTPQNAPARWRTAMSLLAEAERSISSGNIRRAGECVRRGIQLLSVMTHKGIASEIFTKTQAMICPKCGALEVEWKDERVISNIRAFKADNWSFCVACGYQWPENKARFVEVHLPENWTELV